MHYRRDAQTRVFVTPLGASARGPERSGGFLGPYFWYDDKERSLRFIPFLHILGTGSAALVIGYVSEIPSVGLRGAFALPALATLLAGVLAYRASFFVGQDMEAKQRRRQSHNFPPQA